MPRASHVARALLLTAACLLQACSNSLVVSGNFPSPLIKPVPATAGVYFDEDFQQYHYLEDSKDRGKWDIALGSAQTELFRSVLPAVFDRVTEVDALPSDQKPAPEDIVLHPKAVQFQYSVPRETRFKVYEVWMKYNISAYRSNGELLADWIITGYGKTPSAFMQSEEAAMNAAAVVALRDLGANFSLTTFRVPEMRHWLNQYTTSAPPLAFVGRSNVHE